MKEGRQWPKFSTLPTQLYHRYSFDILFEIVLFLSANFAYGKLLGVDHELLEAAARDSRNKVEASKKILLDWLDYQPGTGKKDRSWDTILDTMNEINKSDAQAMVDRLLKVLCLFVMVYFTDPWKFELCTYVVVNSLYLK